MSFKTIKALSRLSILEIGKTLSQVNESFLKEPHLVQFYNRYATYNGSSPYSTPGIMTVIQHLESHYGTYIPEGGMHSITKSLYRFAKEKGVIFNFNKSLAVNFIASAACKDLLGSRQRIDAHPSGDITE